MIYWITGQPGAGKTTIAKELAKILPGCIHIDGDEIRELFSNRDYSRIGRYKNVRLVQNTVRILASKNIDVVVSMVSPFIGQREELKILLGDNIIEIYVHTDNEGEKDSYHYIDYQAPINNFIDIDTTDKTIEQTMFNLKMKL